MRSKSEWGSMLNQIHSHQGELVFHTCNFTSFAHTCEKIRKHYGFQSSGARFLDETTIIRQPDERPKDPFQFMAFFEDNLMTANRRITHHGGAFDANEDLTPTLESTIVVLWLQLIHPELLNQKYGSELRSKSLAPLKPEV